MSTAFDIKTGLPLFDTGGGQSSAAITADSRYLLLNDTCMASLFDRSGHRVWQQQLVPQDACHSNNNRLAWIAPDARRIVVAVSHASSQFDSSGTVVLLTAPSLTRQRAVRK